MNETSQLAGKAYEHSDYTIVITIVLCNTDSNVK